VVGFSQKNNPPGIAGRVAIFLLLRGVYANFFLVAAPTLKADLTVYHSEQGIIAAFTYVGAGVYFCAALPYEYISGQHKLAVGAFCAKAF